MPIHSKYKVEFLCKKFRPIKVILKWVKLGVQVGRTNIYFSTGNNAFWTWMPLTSRHTGLATIITRLPLGKESIVFDQNFRY